MQPNNKEVMERILEENEEFRRAYDAHQVYGSKLAEFANKRFLSSEEEYEKKRLKKLKLAEKDKMERILSEQS